LSEPDIEQSLNTLKIDNTSLSLRLWLRMLGCTRLIENDIRKDLRESFDTTLPRFDVMAQLYRYPDGLWMSEISRLLMVTNGNVTGIIDGLAQEGLAERTTDGDDRRAYIVRLTPSGSAAFEDMASQHRDWVDGLLDGLDDEEREKLYNLLSKLRDSLYEKLEKADE
jgi:DNA-binding MarR family transcriptional regulator